MVEILSIQILCMSVCVCVCTRAHACVCTRVRVLFFYTMKFTIICKVRSFRSYTQVPVLFVKNE